MGKLANSSAFDRRTITVATGASQSSAFDLEGYPIVGLLFPTTWTAANASFLAASATGGTFRRVDSAAGGEIVVTAGAGRAVGLTAGDADAVAPWNVMKLRIATSTAAVTATVAQTVKVFLKG